MMKYISLLCARATGRKLKAGCRAQRGFTLIEVLVVLVLLSLLTGGIFQGLSSVLRIRTGLLDEVKEQRSGALYANWLQSVLSATVPVLPSGDGVFAGRVDGLSGVSLGSLTGVPGAPTLFKIYFSENSGALQLHYEDQSGAGYILGDWQDSSGSFSYVSSNELYNRWPPKTLLTTFPQLPEAVVVEVDGQEGKKMWVLSIPGRKEPKKLVYDEFK